MQNYNTLIQGRCKKGNVMEDLNLYNYILEKGLDLNNSSYTMLISRLCKEGKMKDVMDLFSEMLKRDLILLSCIDDDLGFVHF